MRRPRSRSRPPRCPHPAAPSGGRRRLPCARAAAPGPARRRAPPVPPAGSTPPGYPTQPPPRPRAGLGRPRQIARRAAGHAMVGATWRENRAGLRQIARRAAGHAMVGATWREVVGGRERGRELSAGAQLGREGVVLGLGHPQPVLRLDGDLGSSRTSSGTPCSAVATRRRRCRPWPRCSARRRPAARPGRWRTARAGPRSSPAPRSARRRRAAPRGRSVPAPTAGRARKWITPLVYGLTSVPESTTHPVALSTVAVRSLASTRSRASQPPSRGHAGPNCSRLYPGHGGPALDRKGRQLGGGSGRYGNRGGRDNGRGRGSDRGARRRRAAGGQCQAEHDRTSDAARHAGETRRVRRWASG